MIDAVVRLVKRVLVFIPGIFVTYFTVRNLYPVIDRRLPAAVAILLTYIIIAYILIPALLRLIRIFHKTDHIPLYCVTPDGFASDPVNVGVTGTEQQLIDAMQAAGWHKADKRTLKTTLKLIVYTLLRKPYPTAPFSNLYLFGRKQDIGFQLPLTDNPSHRHHVRFWAVRPVGDPNHAEHVHFWHRHHASLHARQRVFWVGAASKDIGIAPIRHNAQLTHLIHEDTNAERELIIRQLRQTGKVKKVRTVTVGKPYRLRNRVMRGYFQADGKMKIAEL